MWSSSGYFQHPVTKPFSETVEGLDCLSPGCKLIPHWLGSLMDLYRLKVTEASVVLLLTINSKSWWFETIALTINYPSWFLGLQLGASSIRLWDYLLPHSLTDLGVEACCDCPLEYPFGMLGAWAFLTTWWLSSKSKWLTLVVEPSWSHLPFISKPQK